MSVTAIVSQKVDWLVVGLRPIVCLWDLGLKGECPPLEVFLSESQKDRNTNDRNLFKSNIGLIGISVIKFIFKDYYGFKNS